MKITKWSRLFLSSSALIVGASIPISACTQDLSEIGKLHPASVNLTAGKFFSAFTSDEISQRKNAQIYLLGVLDDTEGKSWCSYKKFKTITIYEQLFGEFKKLDKSTLEQRASTVIGEIMKKKFPCGDSQ